MLAFAGAAIACRADAKRAETPTVMPTTVAASGHPTNQDTTHRYYTLEQMEANHLLPFEEEGYTGDCSRITVSGSFELEGHTWSQRDSVGYRCADSTTADSVETGEGPFRFAGDTLHLENAQGAEVEIAHISGDTLRTGLGISGSTPRLYVRIRQPNP